MHVLVKVVLIQAWRWSYYFLQLNVAISLSQNLCRSKTRLSAQSQNKHRPCARPKITDPKRGYLRKPPNLRKAYDPDSNKIKAAELKNTIKTAALTNRVRPAHVVCPAGGLSQRSFVPGEVCPRWGFVPGSFVQGGDCPTSHPQSTHPQRHPSKTEAVKSVSSQQHIKQKVDGWMDCVREDCH